MGLDFDIGSSQTFHRQIAIGFVGATRGFENGLDSQMFGREPTDFALTVDGRTEPYVIIGIESFDENAEIPLHVFADINRNMTFSVDEQTGLDNQKIYLNDYQEGFYYEIQDTPKEIAVNAGTYQSRFTVSFKIPASLSAEENNLLNEVTIFHDANSKEVVVKSSSVLIEKVEVYNLLGQDVLLHENSTKIARIAVSSEHLKNGVYIVKVKTDKGILNKKIVIE